MSSSSMTPFAEPWPRPKSQSRTCELPSGLGERTPSTSWVAATRSSWAKQLRQRGRPGSGYRSAPCRPWRRSPSGARTTPETIVVAIDLGGGFWATEQALQRAIKEKAVTIGVSGRADAPLTRLPGSAWWCRLGSVGRRKARPVDRGAPSRRPGVVGGGLIRRRLAQLSALPDVVAEILSRADAPTKRLGLELAAVGDYSPGSGPCYASARMAAAKVKEMSQYDATSTSRSSTTTTR